MRRNAEPKKEKTFPFGQSSERSRSHTLYDGAYESREDDYLAVTNLLETYRSTEDDCDLIGQGKLMASDRVLVSQFASGRRIDNNENMRIQQALADRRRHAVPGLKQFSEDRDLLVRFSAHGQKQG